MDNFAPKSICILGRQPSLGLAELESLYGAEHIRPFGGHALLDIPAEKIEFNRLGGTVKTSKILAELPYSDLRRLVKYLTEEIPKHLKHLPSSKFTLGISTYGIKTNVNEINRMMIGAKKILRKDRSIRIVPNKSLALSSAQVLHNKLTQKGAWELLLVSDGKRTLVAQTMFVQDIEAYGARDQVRPARDAKVGMLPPKLAQIIINLALGMPNFDKLKDWSEDSGLANFVVLDPFCGSGVILQEALLMGYSVYGTDKDPRMVEYSKRNLQWLIKKYPKIQGRVVVEQADAKIYKWPGFSVVASETYLGPPLSKFPNETELKKIITTVNATTENFLRNLASQPRAKDRKLCLAVPAWRNQSGRIISLPIIDRLTDIGYTYLDLKYASREQLMYFREDQVVARQLLNLKKS